MTSSDFDGFWDEGEGDVADAGSDAESRCCDMVRPTFILERRARKVEDE